MTEAVILEATIHFLRAHEPFARMARADLGYLAQQLELVYCAVGETIVDSASLATPFYIVQRGHLQVTELSGQVADGLIGPGECFPVLALADDPRFGARYVATEDTFCYRLAVQHCEALRQRSPVLADYWQQSAASLWRESAGGLHREYSERVASAQSLRQAVGTLLRRPPVHCLQTSPIRDALVLMSAAGVGTIVVTDTNQLAVGIFTLTDLMNRVVLGRVPLAAPVSSVMTPRPGTVDAQASAHQALATMALHRHHQLVVTQNGRVSGVISERDLFALQRVSMQRIVEDLATATRVDALELLAADIRRLADNLVAQGASADSLTSTITALNDALTQRLFEVSGAEFDLTGIEWCWLSLGSEGRGEQTVASDQDNALVFACDEPESGRERLLVFAAAINQRLQRLGFPLCPGGIMAGNPRLCLTEEEWRQRFLGWLREPTPEALLEANIFFDFRPIAGNALLANRLRHWLQEMTPEATLFLRLLIENACSVEPPLGRVRTFSTQDFAGTSGIDLKVFGSRLFVDAGRVLALSFGLAETSTAQRLRVGGQRIGAPERDTAAQVEAFHFLQLLRLRSQAAAARGENGTLPANVIDPAALNELEQRVLKESLRQARVLQKHLQLLVR